MSSSSLTSTWRYSRHHGFSLVEVLIAIMVLLIGVVAALMIFPAGFNAFSESQQAETAQKLAKDRIAQFEQYPDSLPDAVYPVGPAYGAPSDLQFDDLTAVNFQSITTSTSTSTDMLNWQWYAQQLFPAPTLTAGSTPTLQLLGQWPLWQPRSVRTMRMIVGEKCSVPSQTMGQVVNNTNYLTTVTGVTGATTISVASAANITNGMYLWVDNTNPNLPGFPIHVIANPSGNSLTLEKSVSAGNFDLSGSATSKLYLYAPLSFVPRYLPQFGPILPNNQEWDSSTNTFSVKDPPRTPAFTGTGTGLANRQPLIIYDKRYTAISQNDLNGKTTEADKLHPLYNYAIDTTADTITFRSNLPRAIRLTFACVNTATTPNYVVQIPPIGITLPQRSSGVAPVSIADLKIALNPNASIKFSTEAQPVSGVTGDEYIVHVNMPANWTIIAGSEQINHAYAYVGTDDGDSNNTNYFISEEEDPSSKDFPLPTAPTYQTQLWNFYDKIARIPSGYYYIDRMTRSNVNGQILPGMIYFARSDAGKTVKIDYITADWNILHDDVAVDSDGYIALSVPDPKIRNHPSYPREPSTWGLYGPMVDSDSNPNVVMGLVDIAGGALYYVNVYHTDANSPLYVAQSESVSGSMPNALQAIDLSEAQQGRVRLGGLDGPFHVSAAETAGVAYTDAPTSAQPYQDVIQATSVSPQYECILAHTGSSATAPTTGASWQTYWHIRPVGGHNFCGFWLPVDTMVPMPQYQYDDGTASSTSQDVVYDKGNYYECIKPILALSTPHTAQNPEPGVDQGWQTYWHQITPNWTALQGSRFRVFYRARNDWTLQFFRAPALFGLTTAANPWWGSAKLNVNAQAAAAGQLVAAGQQVNIAAIYQGQTIGVDYLYENEAYRATQNQDPSNNVMVNSTTLPAVNTWIKALNPQDGSTRGSSSSIAQVVGVSAPNSVALSTALGIQSGDVLVALNGLDTTANVVSPTVVQVVSGTKIKAGMQVYFYDPVQTVTYGPIQVTAVNTASTPPTITLATALSGSLNNGSTVINAMGTLVHVGGETHTVNTSDTFMLQHIPIYNPTANIVPTIRGMSVTVRTLWAEPRNGPLATYDATVSTGAQGAPPAPVMSTLNQRWHEKTATAVLTQ